MTRSGIKAAGTLDQTFGDGGVVTLSTGSRSIVVLNDNKVMIAGGPRAGQLTLSRLTEKGELDPSFGSGGVVTVPGMGGTGIIVTKMIALENGGYLIAGSEAIFSSKKYICRLLGNGQLDQSFGTDGMVTIYASDISADDAAQDLKFVDGMDPQSNVEVNFFSGDSMAVSKQNAKIYLSAHIYPFDGVIEGVVFCLNEDGSKDTSFNGGYVLIPIDFSSGIKLNSLSVQGDGVLVGGGFVHVTGVREVAFLKRYDQRGGLDTSFGDRGTVIIPIGADGRTSIINSVVTRDDGLIVASGDSGKVGENEGFLTVLNANGGFNLIFNNGRPLYAAFLRDLVFNSSVWQQNTKIIVTGTGGGYVAAARYELDGSLDLTFGGKGWALFDGIQGKAPNETSHLTSDNKVVVHLGSGWESNAVRYLA